MFSLFNRFVKQTFFYLTVMLNPIFSDSVSLSLSVLCVSKIYEYSLSAHLIGSFPHELFCRHFPDGRNSDDPSHIIVVKVSTCLITQLLQDEKSSGLEKTRSLRIHFICSPLPSTHYVTR